MPETDGTVLITTHDLETAGVLREAFKEVGYRVELITPTETLSAAENPVLLILTGELLSDPSARLADEARTRYFRNSICH